MSFGTAAQLIKGGSSKWVLEAFPKYQQFAWQEGYGAFSVSTSQMGKTIAYIQAQKEHHRRRTFQEEFKELLERHAIEYDGRYLFANE
jgi:putative transposase